MVPRIAFVPPGCAMCCSILSVFGVLFLFIMGSMIKHDVEMIVGGEDGFEEDQRHSIASACYQAGALYTVLLLFCGCQAWVHLQRNANANGRQRHGSAVTVDELHH